MATIDPPWRLDPFQNIVNVNWLSSFPFVALDNGTSSEVQTFSPETYVDVSDHGALGYGFWTEPEPGVFTFAHNPEDPPDGPFADGTINEQPAPPNYQFFSDATWLGGHWRLITNYGGTTYYDGGGGGVNIYYSKDGVNWTVTRRLLGFMTTSIPHSSTFWEGYLDGLSIGAKVFVAAIRATGQEGLWTSKDGITWSNTFTASRGLGTAFLGFDPNSKQFKFSYPDASNVTQSFQSIDGYVWTPSTYFPLSDGSNQWFLTKLNDTVLGVAINSSQVYTWKNTDDAPFDQFGNPRYDLWNLVTLPIPILDPAGVGIGSANAVIYRNGEFVVIGGVYSGDSARDIPIIWSWNGISWKEWQPSPPGAYTPGDEPATSISYSYYSAISLVVGGSKNDPTLIVIKPI